MIFLYVILGILALYVFFIVFPAVFFTFGMFAPKKSVNIDDLSKNVSYYSPYIDEMREYINFMKSQKVEKVQTTSYDGTTLYGDFYSNGSKRTAIFVHGFCSDSYINFPKQMKELYQMGFNILTIHQRAHDGYSGKTIGLGLIEKYDVVAWAKWAEDNSSSAILLYGTSMGATSIAYASNMLNADKVKAMVIDCGYISPASQIKRNCDKRHLPYKLLIPIMKTTAKAYIHQDIVYPVTTELKKTNIPALFVYATGDTTVRIEEGKELYNSCASQKDMIITDGAEHTLGYLAGKEKSQIKFIEFINKTFGGKEYE